MKLPFKRRFFILPKSLILKLFPIALILILLAGWIGFNAYFFPAKTEAAWFSDNWLFRQSIPIATHSAAENNVYITFQLDTATLITAGQLQSSCQDIRVTDVNGKLLKYHVGRTNACNNAATTIDALVPVMPAGAQTYYVYYGNGQALSNDAGTLTPACGNSCTTNPTLGSAEKAPSPSLYWKFDEGQGTVAHNSNGPSAIKLEQSNITVVTASTSTPISFTATPRPGNIVILAIGYFNTTTQINTPTDNQGNTYQIIQGEQNATSARVRLYYAQNINANGTFTITTTTSSSSDMTIAAFEYSGVDKTNPIDQSTSNVNTTGSTTPTTTSSITTTANGDVLFAAMVHSAATNISITAGTNYTLEQTHVGGATDMPLGTEDLYAVPIGTYTASFTLGGSANWGIILAALKPVAQPTSGTLISTTWQTEDMCISGKCLYFDGTGGDRVATTPTIPTTDFTYSAWVRLTDTSDNRTIFGAEAATASGDNDELVFYFPSGSQRLAVKLDGTEDQSNGSVPLNRWTFVEVTRIGTNVKIYFNGILDVSYTRGNALSFASGCNLYIGSDPTNGCDESGGTFASTFKGYIDEAKVYPFGRSAAQVLADYNAQGDLIGAAENTSNSQNNPNALSNGLVGYWKMDETSWATNCSTASAIDSSGNGNNGAPCPNGSAATLGVGKFGNAGVFDGTNDYINTGTGLVSLGGTQNYSMSAWIFPTSAKDETILARYNGGVAGEWYMNMNSGQTITCEREAAPNGVTSTSTVSLNTWHHVSCVYDNTAGVGMKIYIDGKLDKNDTTVGSASTAGSEQVLIGAYKSSSSTTQFFAGRIDETRIYNRALSSTDITNLYNFAPGPTGYWKMEDGVGSSAVDSSGNGLTETWGGTPNWSNGKYGKAAKLDGSTQYLGTTGNDNFQNYNRNFTIEMWVKPVNAAGSAAGLMGHFTPASGDMSLVLNFGGLQFASAQQGNVFTGNATLSNNVWSHIAITIDGNSTANAVAYINGLVDQTTTTTFTFNSSAAPLYIGGTSSGGTRFNGSMDEVKIYNYARTQKQIIEDINAGHPPPGSPVGSPYGYWKFEQGADNRCSGGTNDACNSGNGGNGLDGAETNMATAPSTSTSGWVQSGKFGKALAFDGSDDRVDVGDLTGTETATQLSWSFWVNPTTLSTDDCIFCKFNGSAATQRSWGITTGSSDSSKVRAYVFTGATDAFATNFAESQTGALTNGTWTHVAIVYDGTQATADRIKIYINGTAQTVSITGTITASGPPATTSTARFGATSDATAGQFLAGVLDEPKVYLGALTPDQVKIDMNNGQTQQLGAAGNNTSYQTGAANQEFCVPGDATSCTAPLGKWDFEEGSGATAFDTSGNGNNATWTADAAAPTRRPGKTGQALNFLGATNRAANAGSAAALDDLSALTAEAWVSPNISTEAADRGIITKADVVDPANGWVLAVDTTSHFEFLVDYPTVNLQRITTNTYSPNTWYYIQVTWDGSATATNAHIYINGVEATYSTSTNGTGGSRVTDAAQSLEIGGVTGTTAGTINAKIDQARVYNYVRSGAQLSWDYNKGGPVAWWKADDCQGTTLNDASGKSNPGTLTVGATGTENTVGTCTTSSTAWGNGATGKRNSSIDLDGTDDQIQVTNNASFNFDFNQDFSVSTWIKAPSDQADLAGTINTIITKWDGTGAAYPFDIRLFNSTSGSNAGKIQIARFDATNNPVVSSRTLVNTSTFHMVTLTKVGSVLSIYIDGVLDNTGTDTTSTTTTNANNLFIGSRGTTLRHFTGSIDDTRIYNYGLTASQVKQVYNNGAATFAPATGAP